MRSNITPTRFGVISLVVLGLIAVGLSLAAVIRHRPVTAVVGATQSPAGSSTAPAAPPSDAPGASQPPTSSSPATPAKTPTGTLTVVILGDSFSVGENNQTWVGAAAAELGWGKVVNLSSAGRGYLATPGQCNFTPCATFRGTIPAVVEAKPDVVITFGGTADGDFSLEQPAATYYRELRSALPGADIVAISPITTDAKAPYWLTLHAKSIRTGVTAVGGTFVDIGQPALGGSEPPSAQAHAAIAQKVIDRLSPQ